MSARLETDNSVVVGKSDEVSKLLLADTIAGTGSKSPSDSTPKSSKPSDTTIQVAAGGPGIGLWLAMEKNKQEGEKPKPAEQKTAEEAKTVASVVTGFSERVVKDGKLRDSDRDSVHTEFNKQLDQTAKYRPEERAAQLRSYINAANEKLLADKSGLYFTENKSPGKDQISISLVDKGEKSLVQDRPSRTVYDTEVYNVGATQLEAKNVPQRDQVPEDLRKSYDHIKSTAKATVMTDKFQPALKKVVEDAGLAKLTRQDERNKAVGLPADASMDDFHKELEKRMMTTLGKSGVDYTTEYNRDLNREFVKQLGLKPGVNTQAEIVEALKKVKVPTDAKK